MTDLILKHRRHRCDVDCTCVCQNGVWLVPCTNDLCNHTISYLRGIAAPQYPLPAIILSVEWRATNYCSHPDCDVIELEIRKQLRGVYTQHKTKRKFYTWRTLHRWVYAMTSEAKEYISSKDEFHRCK